MSVSKLWHHLTGRPDSETGSSEAPPETAPTILRVRRKTVQGLIVGFLATDFLMFLRFFFPRVLYEPKTNFIIGYPSDFHFGVDTRFQSSDRIWVVRNAEGLFAIFARCTHLGCTPNWMPSEQKFKCPCHGSGYDSEGINFEGPAPRPMDRAQIALMPDGEIQVDTSILFQYPNWEGPNVMLRGV